MLRDCYLPATFIDKVEYFWNDKVDSMVPTDPVKVDFVNSFRNVLNETFIASVLGGKITGSKWNQEVFNQCVQDTCVKLFAPKDGIVNKFSSTKDHFGREMVRLVLNDKPSHCRYIIDTYSNLDVKLVISHLKRFVLTHIPRKWSNIDFNDIVPRILFRVNVWDTPRSYYKLSLYDCPVNVEYTHKVESARSLVGLPSSVTQKELKCYERADYDIRRAIFGEFTNVSKPRTSRAC